jgi:hypothetical protein
VNSNVYASLSYHGGSDSENSESDRTNRRDSRGDSRIRKFPGSSQSSESRISESFDTARGPEAIIYSFFFFAC